MDASGISSVQSQKKCRSITTALASAVLEWFLIFLLFIEAIYSYLIIKFASYYELQKPCLLCSQLDNVFRNRKVRYYCDLICGKHKLEISSLVLCRAHNKLVDVHGMCESCLFSFATINKSNAETYRLLVGKLGEGSQFSLRNDALLEDHTLNTQKCSCCNQSWIPRAYGGNLMQNGRRGSEAAELDAVYHQDDLNNVGPLVPTRNTRQRNKREFEHLPHIGYTELNVNSDTESEVLFSDDDINANLQSRAINPKEDDAVKYVQAEPRIITLLDDLASEKLIDSVTAYQSPVSASQTPSDYDELHGITSISPVASVGHSLEEFQWQQADEKSDRSAVPELISLDGIPPSSTATETPSEAAKESKQGFLDDVPPSVDTKVTVEEASKESKRIAGDNIPPSSSAGENLAEAFESSKPISEEDILPSSSAGENPAEASESSKLISEDVFLPSSDSKGTPGLIPAKSNLVSLADVLPSSIEAETPVQGLQRSSVARNVEVWQTTLTDNEEIGNTRTKTTIMNETAAETSPIAGENRQHAPNSLDLGDAYKLAVGSRGRQLSGTLTEQWIGKDSSRLSDDLKILFSHLSAREQMMNETSPSPRPPVSPKLSINGDELKNLDPSSLTGMQILQKRISLERNESGQSLDGSSVSEIEGESAVDRMKRQIEHDKKLLSALYKELEEERNASAISANQAMAMITRLQEEKATLQMEALQCLRVMEEQAEYDMEALHKTNDLLSEREKEIQDLEAELEFYRNNPEAISASTSTPGDPDAEKSDTHHGVEERTMPAKDKKAETLKNSLLSFDEEKRYIIQCLKKLETRLRLFPDDYIGTATGEYPENSEDNEVKENDEFSSPKDGGNSPAREFNSSDSVASEVLELNKRLKALEADKDFLEHSINSIRNGEEGLQFIREIASHLKELRIIGMPGSEPRVD